MLVNCPKCGFSQPQDRYCASCGIDIEHFKPAATPIWKKILGNPFIHVGFIFLLVFVSIMFIRKQQREDLRARVEYLKGGPVLVERQQQNQQQNPLPDVPPPTPSEPDPLGPPAAMVPPPAPPPSAAPMPASPIAGSAQMTVKALDKNIRTSETGAKVVSTKMVVTYAELDRVTLDAWHDEMRAAGQLRQFGTVSLGALTQASAKIKSAHNFKVLQKINRNIESTNPNLEWFIGTHHGSDPDNEMGLFSSLAMNSDSKDNLIRGEIEVQRAFRDPKDPAKTMERVSFGGPFELAPGAAYLMTGLIPRNFVTELDDEMNPDAFLSIFKSRAFLNRETEFTLILEFDTSGK